MRRALEADHRELHAYLEGRVRLLLAPNLQAARADPTPLPVYAPGSLRVVRTPSENLDRLGAVARAFHRLGVSALRPELCGLRQTRGSGLVLDARLVHLDAFARVTGASDLSYYVERGPFGLRTAMVEIGRCPAYALAFG
ncbi:MAG: hypothetical protein V2I65_02150 [Paracoccaceae bacterium]|jgi:hypothetical protein|nr:hypothetical protein [Paracoccaceae bacterium]